MDTEDPTPEKLTDRELLEQIARDIAAARAVAEQLMEQFNGIANDPKFSMIAKVLGIGK